MARLNRPHVPLVASSPPRVVEGADEQERCIMSAAHAPCYAMLGVASFIVPQRLSLDTRVSLLSCLDPWSLFSLGILSLAVSPPPLLLSPPLGFLLDIWNWLVYTTIAFSGLLSLGDIITSSLLLRISNDLLSLPRTNHTGLQEYLRDIMNRVTDIEPTSLTRRLPRLVTGNRHTSASPQLYIVGSLGSYG
ncbi:hypothetical protein BC629DRAFT_1594633 [Irpex lacteus]|nr:hypothetical protein BC629DRAFT_1594633 [Irpex lacteus]